MDITKKDRRIMRWGSYDQRLKLLLSAIPQPDFSGQPSNQECMQGIERVAALLRVSRPARNYQQSRAFGMENHYGYLFRLFLFQRAWIAGEIPNAAFALADLIEESRAAVFQPRILYAILGTITPTALNELEAKNHETALEHLQNGFKTSGDK